MWFRTLKLIPMIRPKDTTLTENIAAAQKKGFTKEFYFRDGKINTRNSTQSYGQQECKLVGYSRHEGMTDPSDSSILFLIEGVDGSKGYLSSAYGIYADTDTMDFVLSLKRKDNLEIG